MRPRSGGTSKLPPSSRAGAPASRSTRKMIKAVRAAAALGVALALLVPVASASGEDVDPAAREWTQVRGNATRSACSAVEPLAGEPTPAWEQKLPGPVLAEPVTWG